MSIYRRLSRYSLTVASACVLALAAMQAPAHAAEVHYVALGDSYASGVGTGTYYNDGSGCYRSPQAYAPLWAAAHSAASFTFAACGGAVTSGVISDQLGALNASTTHVTISIGGNDAGFVNVVLNCRFGTDSGCNNAVVQAETFATTQLGARLDQTYAAIRAAAPNAQLIVLGYPHLFEPVSNCGFGSLSLYKRNAINRGADTLATVIAGRAQAAGATFVDARPAFAGHGVCSTGTWWINGPSLSVGESYHPKASGYTNAYLPALTAVTG